MSNPFLFGDATARSLNRVVFDCVEHGQTQQLRGYPDIGSPAVWEATLAWAGAKGLDCRDGLAIERAFFSAEADPIAQAVARTQGNRLGHLLLALKQGRAIRDGWQAEQIAYWQTVERVVVGGGRTQGWFGRHLLNAARVVLAGSGLHLERANVPVPLTHLGLANLLPKDALHGLLIDFGQTNIKAALATRGPDGKNTIDALLQVPSDCAALDAQAQTVTERAVLRWDSMQKVIARAVALLPSGVSRRQLAVGVSIACYLEHGQPIQLEQGCYGVLQNHLDHLQSALQTVFVTQHQLTHSFILLNDGPAIGAAFGPEVDAVLSLGTAIALGFPGEHLG